MNKTSHDEFGGTNSTIKPEGTVTKLDGGQFRQV